MRHFLDLLDLSRDDITHLLQQAIELKQALARGDTPQTLRGKVVGLLFEKPSLRTRVSFETAVAHLGGTSLFIMGQEVGIGSRESIADIARSLCQYVDAMVLRTFSHATVTQFAQWSDKPVVNGLSDYYHPCQALGDLLTMKELFGDVSGRTLVFVGDGNNVARSLSILCAQLSVRFVLAAPEGYGFDGPFREIYRQHFGAEVEETVDAPSAVKSADVIYTDVWTSMGQESEREQRLLAFAGYQVNGALLAMAPAHAKVMHCLPARRGEEVTGEVIDGPRSVVFPQAGNRMHAQKALLHGLLG
jgi:ornithine carbamoyltransferase